MQTLEIKIQMFHRKTFQTKWRNYTRGVETVRITNPKSEMPQKNAYNTRKHEMSTPSCLNCLHDIDVLEICAPKLPDRGRVLSLLIKEHFDISLFCQMAMQPCKLLVRRQLHKYGWRLAAHDIY